MRDIHFHRRICDRIFGDAVFIECLEDVPIIWHINSRIGIRSIINDWLSDFEIVQNYLYDGFVITVIGLDVTHHGPT